MDNKFQLSNAVNSFIASISSKGTLTAEDEKELSNHLYYSVETLAKNGLSDEEAFEVAKIRLGKKDEIAEEFQKVNGVNMLNKEWVFIFIGIGLAFTAKLITFLPTIYAIKLVSEEIISITTALIIVTSAYLFLILLTILFFKNGEKVTLFIKNNFLDKNSGITGIFLALLGTMSLLIENGIFNRVISTEIYSTILYSNRFTETIIRGTIPALLVFSILLSTQSVTKKLGWKTLFSSNNYIYTFLLGFTIEIIAAIFSRMLFMDAWFSPIIFGIVYFVGVWCYLKYNKNNNWIHFALFIATPIFFEAIWGYFNSSLLSNIGTFKSPFAWAIIIAILAAFIGSKKVLKTSS